MAKRKFDTFLVDSLHRCEGRWRVEFAKDVLDYHIRLGRLDHTIKRTHGDFFYWKLVNGREVMNIDYWYFCMHVIFSTNIGRWRAYLLTLPDLIGSLSSAFASRLVPLTIKEVLPKKKVPDVLIQIIIDFVQSSPPI